MEIREILPRPLLAGEQAGVLTEEGAGLLDPEGTLKAGIPLCPPEGECGNRDGCNKQRKGAHRQCIRRNLHISMIVLEKSFQMYILN